MPEGWSSMPVKRSGQHFGPRRAGDGCGRRCCRGRPPPRFVIGREADVPNADGWPRPALSNVLLLSKPGSAFVDAWRSEIAGALDGIAMIHLMAHLWWDEDRRDFSNVHAGMIDEKWIRTSYSTYATAARRFLPERSS